AYNVITQMISTCSFKSKILRALASAFQISRSQLDQPEPARKLRAGGCHTVRCNSFSPFSAAATPFLLSKNLRLMSKKEYNYRNSIHNNSRQGLYIHNNLTDVLCSTFPIGFSRPCF